MNMKMNKKTKIKVIGVGGSGSNAISRMSQCKIEGVDLIAINTDIQDLKRTKADFKLRIGRDLTKGLGTGMNPEMGKKAAMEQKEEISEILKDTDLVFITYGLGGGTGTGAGPIIAEIAKQNKALTVAVVTKPFSFEGAFRAKIAQAGLENLKEKVDTLLAIPNERILSLVDKETTLVSAFWMSDEILRQAVSGISDLISKPGIVNVDFADLKTIMKGGGQALFGQGKARGEKRIEKALNLALNSPLLDFSIKGAKGILFNISGGQDLSLAEVKEAAKIISKVADQKAKIIFGAIQDKTLKKGEIKITVIATGF